MTDVGDQNRTPILDTLADYLAKDIYPFHTPGHKGGRFVPPELTRLWGADVLAFDLPAMTATDNTLHPTGCVLEAQQLAAELFGAAETFYLGSGSTTAVAAMLLAAVPPGETVLIPRNVHRSVASALVLSGARPKFLPHEVLPECGALAVSVEAVAAALREEPRPVAVLLTRPSYYGLASDLTPIAEACHAVGVPLIVDEAHGAHLAFLPPGGLRPALECGADLVAQSSHKTLGSLVGSAQLHVGHHSPVPAAQVRDALNLLQTTSPNYLQLASLDAVRRHLWLHGAELFRGAVEEAERLADEIDAVPGLRVLRPESVPKLAGHLRDPLRLVVNVVGTGWTGYEVERYLRMKHRVEDEMADWFNIVLILSPHDDPQARERLIAGLRSVSEQPREQPESAIAQAIHLLQPAIPPLIMTPREAALGKKEIVMRSTAVDRVCAETITFYPPGIPLIMPGERITAETLAVCDALLAGGAHCYASDPTLGTIRVAK
ncbi:MAG: aminotransferase class I/II-fold pyridoxal phosphate-dependent enzyme [Pirellulales bacterium]